MPAPMPALVRRVPNPIAPPRPLRLGLARLDRRIRWTSAFKGLGRTTVLAIVLLLAAVVVDVLAAPSLTVRWLIWGGSLALVALTLAVSTLRPLLRRRDWIGLAALAERHEPGLRERLTSALDLIAADHPHHGSPALIAALADQAGIAAQELDPTRAVTSAPARRASLAALAALAVLVLPSILQPDPFGRLVQRAAMPWTPAAPLSWFAVEVEPGDRTVAIGSDVPIRANVRPKWSLTLPGMPAIGGRPPRAASLTYTDDAGTSRTLRMVFEPIEGKTGSGTAFAVALPAIERSLTYRVEVGIDRSSDHRLSAVAPPRVAGLAVRVEPPAYTRLPAETLNDPQRIEAWEGSYLSLDVKTDRPVQTVEVRWPDEAATGLTSAARVSGPLAIRLTDREGLVSRPETPRRLVVRNDEPPTLALGGSNEPVDAKPDDLLLVDLTAEDDLAVETVELHYAIERKDTSEGTEPETGRVAVESPGLKTPRVRAEAALSMKSLNLNSGDLVLYRVRVTDGLPAPQGPHVVWSDERRLSVSTQAESLLARRSEARRRDLQKQLDAIKQAAAETRRETEQLRYAADAVRRGNGAWDDDRAKALERRTTEATALGEKLEALARDVEPDAVFAPLADPARRIASNEVESGRSQLEKAARAGDPESRLAELRRADARLGAVQGRLDDLQHQLDVLARRDADRRRLRALAERQDALAARVEELARQGAGPEELDPIRNEQEAVRRELEDLLRRAPELRSLAQAEQAKDAASLAKAAAELASRQREEARQATDPARLAPELQALAEAQKGVEAAARLLAADIDAPLGESGLPRVPLEPLRRAAEALRRGDPNQAMPRLDEARRELERLDRDLRLLPDDPKALARRLIRRQEALRGQVDEAVREVRGKNELTPEEVRTLSKALEPLAGRSEEIAALTKALEARAPEDKKNVARQAVEALNRAHDSLKPEGRRDTDSRQIEALQALNRLANEWPDRDRRLETVRRTADEIARRTDEVARQLRNHVRDVQSNPRRDPHEARLDLARRVESLQRTHKETLEKLDGLRIPDEVAGASPYYDQAKERARTLADTLAQLRKPAEGPNETGKPLPVAGWHVVGPFPFKARPPFDPSAPIDFAAEPPGQDGKGRKWKKVEKVGDAGRINLGEIFDQQPAQSAFAAATIDSPTRRKARLVLGSDDTLTVWLNGKIVFDFQANRSFSPEQDKVDVELGEGRNQLVVRCGNAGDRWEFAVAVRMENPETLARNAEADRVHEKAAEVAVRAKGAADRLADALHDRPTVDALAAELAQDQKALEESARQARTPEDRKKLANDQDALAAGAKALDAPDVENARDVAADMARQAAQSLAESKAKVDPTEAVAEATKAFDALNRETSLIPNPDKAASAPKLPADPELGVGAEQQTAAHEVLHRQRRVIDQARAVIAKRAESQEKLKQEAVALGKKFSELHERGKSIGAPHQGAAQAASELTGRQAPESMEQGIEHLEGGRMNQAREMQRRAADQLSQAAQQAEDLAAALAAERPTEEMAEGNPADPAQGEALDRATDSIRQARDALEQAGQGKPNGPTEPDGNAPSPADASGRAAEAMRQAARELRSASQPRGSAPSTSQANADPSQQQTDPHSAPAGTSDPELAKLQDLVRKTTGRSWGELPGHLRTEILQMSKTRYREDYAALIRLYFRQIAESNGQR